MPIRGLALVLLFALAPAVLARDMTPAERLADFDQLVGLVRSQYGMLEHKKQTLGIDVDRLVAEYRPRVEAVAADGAFYELIHTFVAEFRDGHFAASNPSARRARLGFGCKRAEGKAVIDWIDRKALPEDVFPFRRGDELVALDGKPVAQVVAESMPAVGHGNEAGSLAFATGMLTWRHGSLGAVPAGVVRVDVRRFGGEVETVMLPWLVKGETLPGLSFHGRAEGVAELPPAAPGALGLDLAATLKPRVKGERPRPAGAREIESKFFEAYTFDTPKGPMGYIRIPDFSPENDDTEGALEEMALLLKDMWYTRGLVLDLTDNPGGYITYCYQLAALFLSKPLEMQTISQRATRKLLAASMRWRDSAESPLEQALVAAAIDGIRAALAADKAMTEFGFPYGVSAIAPGGLYDKPILMLIDEACFSCGDIFPALLQDNGRAVLFGHTTGGGGGAVTSFGSLAYSGIAVRMTLNLWKRSSGGYIENVGVKPDIAYEHTQKDLAEGNKAYHAAIEKALLDLVK